MGFENLTDIHTRRHAERVQHQIDMGTVFEIGHILDWHDLRDDTLVAMTAGHLVARLQLALHRNEDLDHFHDARRQLVATLQLFDLVLETLLESTDRFVELLLQRLDLDHALAVLHTDLAPLARREFRQHLVGDLGIRLQCLRTAGGNLIDQLFLQAAVEVALEDDLFVVAILGQTFDLGPLDRQGTFVLVDAPAREHPHFDDGTCHARRQAHRRVTDIRDLFTEDGAQQLFFWRHRAFALRRHLTDQNIARLHFGTDIDDAGFVEILQRFFTHVRNVAGDFFLAELGVTGHDFEFLDMDRGEDIVGNEALRDQDRIFEVVALPRHEGDQHVAAERQLTEFGRGTVSDDIALLDRITNLHQRTLVDAGILVRALELQQVIDIDARGRGIGFLGGTNDDTGGVNLVDDPLAAGGKWDSGTPSSRALQSAADQRRISLQQRHRLALHVRAHQRAVGVIVLQERNERCRNGVYLLRANVDALHIVKAAH